MRQTGIVESVSGGSAKVRIKRESACGGNCAGCVGCGISTVVVTAQNKAGAKTGDTVELEMPSERVLSAAVLVYIVPLVFFIIGDIIFNNIFKNEVAALGGGTAAAGIIYAVIIRRSKKNKDKYRLVIEKVVDI